MRALGRQRGFILLRMRRRRFHSGRDLPCDFLRGLLLRFDIAFGRGIANLLQAQPAHFFQLIFILDLEAAEGKWVIHPRQVKVDIKADA